MFGQGSSLLAVVGSIGLAVTAMSAQSIEHGARVQLESQYEYVVASVEAIQHQLRRFAHEAAEAQEEINWLQQQLQQERLKATLQQGDLTIQSDTVEQLYRKIADLEQTKQTLEARLESATARLAAVVNDVAQDSPGSVTLEKIVVESRPVVDGQILMVNREYEFVVVNLGSHDDLRVGDTVAVYHNGVVTARARIERVRQNTAAASIVSGWSIANVHEDDQVRRL